MKDTELKMAIQLAEMSASDEFRPEAYPDEVSERVRALILAPTREAATMTEEEGAAEEEGVAETRCSATAGRSRACRRRSPRR